MNTLIIGDIHGHIGSVERALAWDGPVVFVGDFLDSFTQSPENQVECLRLVLDAAERDDCEVTALIGNHELSYMDPRMRCSGYKQRTQALVNNLLPQMERLLLPYVWINGVLVTHAGVSQNLLYEFGWDLETYLEVGQFKQIGRYRGGTDNFGGLFWNDFNAEMLPVPDVTQVCGHTNWDPAKKAQGVRVCRENGGVVYCVDNLNRAPEAVYITDSGEVHVTEF